MSGEDMVFTAYRISSGHDYPWVQTGVIRHRRDLSDVGEPYLSAIKNSVGNVPDYDSYEEWRKVNDG